MERYEVLLSQEADADIRNILHYIAVTLREVSAAERMLDQFTKTIRSLETMPERFALVPDSYLASMGFRMTSVGNYLLFYTVDRETKQVDIPRVLYGRRNWVVLLTGTLDAN